MKKIIIALLLLIFCLPVIAANWQQYTYKGWYDISNWTRFDNKVTMWFKDLNDGRWDLINKKKIWYNIIQYEANCSMHKIRLLSSTSYGLNGEVLDSYELPQEYRKYDYGVGKFYTEEYWHSVVPESVGEAKYYTMCNMR